MIDAVDLVFAEDLADFARQAAGAVQIRAERLFDDDAGPAQAVDALAGEPRPSQASDDGHVKRGRKG